MSNDDDWEREYEEDMRRMQAGENIEVPGRRQNLTSDDSSKVISPKESEQTPARNTTFATTSVMQTAPPACTKETPAPYTPSNTTGEVDERMGIPYVSLSPTQAKKWNNKFGKRIFFAETVSLVETGWFGRETLHTYTCILGPNTIYLVDGTGNITHGMVVLQLHEVYEVGAVRALLRAVGSPYDFFLSFRSGPSRNFFLSVVNSAATYNRKSIKVQKYPLDQKINANVKKRPPPWSIVEDPRTGLPLVYIPSAFNEKFSFLNDKLVHFFSECTMLHEDWKSSVTSKRCLVWLSPTCLYFCDIGGPKGNQKGYIRCVAIEQTEAIFLGPHGYLGVKFVKGGNNYQDLLFQLQPNDVSIVQSLVFAIKLIYAYRGPADVDLMINDLSALSVGNDIKSVRDCFVGRVSVQSLKNKDTIYPMHSRVDLLKILMEPK